MPHKKWSFKDFLRQMKGKELMWNDNQIGYWVPQTNKNVCCRATLHILARNLICNFTHIRCLLWNTANQASTEKLTRGITQTSFGYGWVHDYEKFISTRGLPYVTSAKFSDFFYPLPQLLLSQISWFCSFHLLFGDNPSPTHCGRHIWKPPTWNVIRTIMSFCVG